MILHREIFIERKSGEKRPTQLWIAQPLQGETNIKVKHILGMQNFEALQPQVDITKLTEKSGYIPNTANVAYLEVDPNIDFFKVVIESTVEPDKLDLPTETDYLNKQLEEELFIDFKNEEIEKLDSEIKEYKRVNGIMSYSDAAARFVSINFQYKLEQSNRSASMVAMAKYSDWCGFHLLYSALLRKNNIPAVIVFGYRGDKDEGYHNCCYIFENNKWKKVDISDIQQNNGNNRPFIPMSIGTGIDIGIGDVPNHPKGKIQYFQHSLVWIDDSEPTRVVKSVRIYN